MKKIIVIKTHSFIDVITNSSTELFVTNGEKTLEQVEEIITEKWALFAKLYNYSGDINSILKIKSATEDDMWANESYDANIKKGDVIIIGTDDNSIPYEFFDVIENFFEVERFHLG